MDRDIPNPIKRQLRQEADFGCCKCGVPILEYHHILGWKNGHNPENIMALCPTCHSSIESYSEKNQRQFKDNPFNKKNENPREKMIISQGICAISTGSITLLGDGPIITNGNKTYFSAFVNEDDILEISLQLFDKENNLLLEIEKNEWKKGNIEIWDIEFISASKVLKIRQKEGKINLEINASEIPVVIKGDFWIDGDLVSFSKTNILLNNISGIEIDNGESHRKFGKLHYCENGLRIEMKEGKLKGGNIYSGCAIDVDKNNVSILLKPKPQPFGLKISTSDEAERLLLQQIKTQQNFYSRMTIMRESSPFFSAIEIVEEPISMVYFLQQLARFYVKTNQISKALNFYKNIVETQKSFFQKPNKEQGEVFFELARLFLYLNDINNAKESFKSAVICFLGSSFPLPFRFLDFSKNLYQRNDPCFCGSNKKFKRCHLRFCNLEPLSDKKINIKLHGIPKDSKLTIHFLKHHITDLLLPYEEYYKGYIGHPPIIQKIDSKFSKDLSTEGITVNGLDHEVPGVIRIDKYGKLPLIIETVFRKDSVF